MDINNFLSKIFGNKATRDMKAIQPYVDKVKEIYPTFAALSNDELRAKTKEIQTKVQNSADDLKRRFMNSPRPRRESWLPRSMQGRWFRMCAWL